MKRILIVVALLAVLLIAADVIHLEIGQPFLPNLDCSLNYLGKYQGPGGRWFFGYQETGVGCQTTSCIMAVTNSGFTSVYHASNPIV